MNISEMKFGRLPAKNDPRTLRLANFVGGVGPLPTAPAAFDWSQKEGVYLDYPVLGNDRYGDCVFASACHCIGTWTGQTGVEQPLLERDALNAYREFTGFREDDPSTDKGAYMLDTVKEWRTHPIAGHTIKAFALVNPSDTKLLTIAANHFGGLWTGWGLPAAWANENELWTVGPGVGGQWAPWSLGGHAMHVVAVSPMGVVVRTWGGLRVITWAAFRVYCDEAFALISHDMWAVLQSDRCPSGIDAAGLDAALERLAA